MAVPKRHVATDASATSAQQPPITILVYRRLNTGGIETLIVRWANALAERGREVIVAAQGGELVDMLAPGVGVVDYADSADLARELRSGIAGRSAHFFSFDAATAYTVALVQLRLGGRERTCHLTGVYHPRAYFEGERRYQQKLNGYLLLQLNPASLVFCNEDCRRTHQDYYGADLSEAEILLLPITERDSRWRAPHRTSLRIVSVGRLVPFKAYNWAIPDMVERLRSSGLDCSWDIWGYGDAQDIALDIERRGLADAVRLRGTAPYAELPDILARGHIFVGMGTAALEAAMLGVPTILACDEEPECSYGWLFDVPPGNMGERLPEPPPQNIADMIRRFAEMKPAEQKLLSERCRDVALQYSLSGFIARADRKLAGAGSDISPALRLLAATHRAREWKDRLVSALRSSARSD